MKAWLFFLFEGSGEVRERDRQRERGKRERGKERERERERERLQVFWTRLLVSNEFFKLITRPIGIP